MPIKEKLDPTLYLLVGLVAFFTVIVIYCEHIFPKDGQVFQVFAGMLTGFGGALLLRVKPRGNGPSGDDNSVNVEASRAPPAVPSDEQPPAK